MTKTVIDVETLVVGAGVIGSSVAMHLANLGMTGVRVIDFDLEGSLSSSELNAGGVRGTWVQPINIQMSKMTIDFFASVADEVGYRACGYLWLHTPERMEGALKARERQVSMGWPVEVLDLAEIRRRLPFIDKTDGIAGGMFGSRDGLLNPNLLKNYLRSQARAKGVQFDDRTLLKKAEYSQDGTSNILLTAERMDGTLFHDAKVEILSGRDAPVTRSTVEYRAKQVVNCAGPWAAKIARILGYGSPCFPVRRQISIFDCRDVDLTPYGMIVDTSGVYFHPEASNGLAGFAVHGEPHGINYEYDGERFFTEYIWSALYERSSAFERLKHLTGWAGQYEVSPDECAVLGQVTLGEAGRNGRVYEAHSFSGHGVMHCYAAGLALAEKMVMGSYQSVDATELGGERFETGRLVREGLVI